MQPRFVPHPKVIPQRRTKQCSGLAIKSVLMESPRSRAADCGRSATEAQSQSRNPPPIGNALIVAAVVARLGTG